MGGGGLGNGAPVAPLDSNQDVFRSGLEDGKDVMIKNHPPVGLVNVGNTCYANAALQCLLSSALSHALLDPASTRIFRRYSSNPDLLSMGSGSVDTDDDEDFFASSPNSSSHKSVFPTEMSDNDVQKKKLKRMAARLKRKENQRKIREKLQSKETCSWVTSELTDITRLYTAKPTEIPVEPEGKWGNLFHLFSTSGPEGAKVVDPGGITRKVNRISPCLRPYQQEDAHEFLRSLLSTLTLDGHNKKLSSLFDGLLESAVTCQTCHRASITRDRYMDLSLDIQGDDVNSLEGALKNFTRTELMDSDNMVRCTRCKTKRVVSKGLRLATAPTILVCHLKRFAFDMYGRTTRLRKHVEYPLRLEIGDHMSRVNQSKPPPYELIGVLVHAGTRCDRGHYFAIVKSGDNWYKANDGVVTQVDLDIVLKQQAYILLYEVEGMRAKHGYDSYGRYHQKRTRSNNIRKGVSRTDDSISSCTKNTDDPTVTDESIVSTQYELSCIKTKTNNRVGSLLDSILNICGSNSVAETVRDAICDSERRRGGKRKPKIAEEHPTDPYLKRAEPLTSTTSSESRLSRHSSLQPLRDGQGPSIRTSSTSIGDDAKPKFGQSDHTITRDDGDCVREMKFLRTKVPLQDEWKINENELSILSMDSQLIKSASSNNLLQKEEEAAIAYEKEYFGDVLPDRTRSRTPIRGSLNSGTSRIRSKSTHYLSRKSQLKGKLGEEDPVLKANRMKWSPRQFSSAPRAGMRSRSINRAGTSLPPMPKRLPQY